jgi:hypothetical protein
MDHGFQSVQSTNIRVWKSGRFDDSASFKRHTVCASATASRKSTTCSFAATGWRCIDVDLKSFILAVRMQDRTGKGE